MLAPRTDYLTVRMIQQYDYDLYTEGLSTILQFKEFSIIAVTLIAMHESQHSLTHTFLSGMQEIRSLVATHFW